MNKRLGRRCVIYWLGLVIGLAWGSMGWGEESPGTLYTIRPGDTLQIQVLGHDEWSLTVTVRPDGCLTYPATGELRAAGLTIAQLTEKLREALGPGGRRLRNPQVLINVVSLRLPAVYVLGAVAKPGLVELPTGESTTLKVLTAAGGATPTANLRQALLYRANGQRQTIDLTAEMRGETEPTRIQAEDLLFIPEQTVGYVGAIGAVTRPGEIALPAEKPTISLLDLLVKVGGVTERADGGRAMIVRANGSIEPVSLVEEQKPNKEAGAETSEKNSAALSSSLARLSPLASRVQLGPGDLLWVPVQPPLEKQYVAVLGAVANPGQVEYREGLTLAEALAASGALSEVADTEHVQLIRSGEEKQTLNIAPLLSGQAPEIGRTPLAPGDVLLVPARGEFYIVLGAVQKAGFYPWRANLTVAEALAQAGGMTKEARLGRMALVRRSSPEASPTVLPIDGRRLLQGDPQFSAITLQPGDTLYVPPHKQLRDILADPLAVASLLGVLTRLFW